MFPLQFDGQYGVAKTVYFTLRQPAATDNDQYYTASAPVQADVKIVQDGTYDNTSDNAPAQVDAVNCPQLYSLQLSAAEMSAAIIDVMIVDAAGAAFRDLHIQVRTKQELSVLDVDASQMTNTTAVTFTGIGSGHGLSCVGGATGKDIDGILSDHVLASGNVTSGSGTSVTLTDGFTATADLYNNQIIMFYAGTGAGQARVITDFTAGGSVTLNTALVTALDTDTDYIILPGPDVWHISPGAELSALPTAASNYADFIQFLFQRFAYKRTMTATTFQMFKVDGSTAIAEATLSDDDTTQTHGALSTP